MTLFLAGAAILIATALAFILPPLLRKEPAAEGDIARDELNLAVLRDQLRELDADHAAGTIDAASYTDARRELQRRVAEDVHPRLDVADAGMPKRSTAALVSMALPIVAACLYLLLGAPLALDPVQRGTVDGNAHEVTSEQIEGMVAKLAERLKSQPEDIEGWQMLARSYNMLGRYDEASDAYGHLVTRLPRDAALLADYADVLAMKLGRTLQGEPEKLVERALAIDPGNLKALALSGTAAFERKDYAAAVARWQRMLPLVEPDSDIARSTSESIREAQQLMGQATAPEQGAKTATARIEGVVDIDPTLRAQAAEDDVVFIFARAAQGPRMPLAVQRMRVKELPATFALDDSMSMTPDAKLSGFSQVVIGARISKSGSAMPGPGDLEGMSQPVAPGATGVKVRIDRRNN